MLPRFSIYFFPLLHCIQLRSWKKYINKKSNLKCFINSLQTSLTLFSSPKLEMDLMIILVPCITIILQLAYADVLQNPDFELPPSNLPKNSNSTFVLLYENNTIPGWTFEGTVQYVTAGPDMPLPRNGHAILVGEDGKINQTFTADGSLKQYLLTFTMSLGGDQDCAENVSLIVSAPDSISHFSLKQNYSKESWQVYGLRLGSWGSGESVNLVLQSEAVEVDPNSTCWPVADALVTKTLGSLSQDNGNLLINGGFELGPAFVDSSSEGVLLDAEPSVVESALQQWSVMGTIKYINSKHYYVPEGDAAVELVSGVGAGIQTAKTLTEGSSYVLEFKLGDANDSCVGDLIVGVQAGSYAQNITFPSNGTGSAKDYSITFNGESTSTSVSFQSYKTSQREDGVFCGPVIDDVVLRSSSALGHEPWTAILIAVLVAAFLASL